MVAGIGTWMALALAWLFGSITFWMGFQGLNSVGGDIVGRYLKHDYKRGTRDFYRIGIPMSLIFGIVFGYLINFTTPPPDRPVEVVGKILANIGVAWWLVGVPLLFIFVIEYRKKYVFFKYYTFSGKYMFFITPKFIKRRIHSDKIRLIICPKIKGSKLENLWAGCIYYVCKNKMLLTYEIDTKAAFRILIHYLKTIRETSKCFKAVIQRGVHPDDWKTIDAIKKSIKNPEVWDKYLEEYWATHNRYYWLNTPLERILEDLHCPYTLEELENPSEDEYVEIDESEIREDVC